MCVLPAQVLKTLPGVLVCVVLRLQAASPDEEALVAGAAYLGTKLVARWVACCF